MNKPIGAMCLILFSGALSLGCPKSGDGVATKPIVVSPEDDNIYLMTPTSDPSAYLGRFVDPSKPNEASARPTECSRLITSTQTTEPGIAVDSVWKSSQSTLVKLGIDELPISAAGQASDSTSVRVQYKLSAKIIGKTDGTSAFDRCCMQEDRCPGAYISEFLGAREVSVSSVRQSGIEATAQDNWLKKIKGEPLLSLDKRRSILWKKGFSWPAEGQEVTAPVYFAFRTTEVRTQDCFEIIKRVPKANDGEYFGGQSGLLESEADALSAAQDQARLLAKKARDGSEVTETVENGKRKYTSKTEGANVGQGLRLMMNVARPAIDSPVDKYEGCALMFLPDPASAQ